MSVLFLSEADIERLLTMEVAIEAVGAIFKRRAESDITNIPRRRARLKKSILHVMAAASGTMETTCTKIYTSTRENTQFHLLLHDGASGELRAILEGRRLGALRTGAVSAVATDMMARADADTVGVFGSGLQAKFQLEAMSHVRDIEEAYVYSPNPEHRALFARDMSAILGINVVPVSKPELAAEDKDIVITATTSASAVLLGEWIAPGAHINAIGGNFLSKSELDLETMRICRPIIVDDKEQCRSEAGELVLAVEEGIVDWADVHELGDVVHQRLVGRGHADDVTLFKSVGSAFEDLAVAKAAYDLAIREGIGQRLPI